MNGRRGMTLMELVVAIALTGMMAAAGAATFASIIDHRRVIRESTVETERAAALREMIRTWIAASSILIQQGGGPRGLSKRARSCLWWTLTATRWRRCAMLIAPSRPRPPAASWLSRSGRKGSEIPNARALIAG